MNDGNLVLAPVWKRILANIFDNALTSIFSFLVILIVTFSLFDGLTLKNIIEFMTIPITEQATLDAMGLGVGQLFFAIYFAVLFIFFNFVYAQTLLTSSQQATFGMRMFSLKLEKIDGTKPSFATVFWRNIVFILFRLIYVGIISIITIILQRYKQGLHDMICRTVVVDYSHGKTN